MALKLGERLGSGDGERKTLLTRQIAIEPLPASVLFALGWPWWLFIVLVDYVSRGGSTMSRPSPVMTKSVSHHGLTQEVS